MNRTNWQTPTAAITVTPLRWLESKRPHDPAPTRRALKNNFHIKLTKSNGQTFIFSEVVYIPTELQPYFLNNEVVAFSTEVLPTGRLASRLLDGEPLKLISSIESNDGHRITALPKPLKMARRVLMTATCLLGLAAGYLLPTGSAVLGALCLAGSVLALKSRADIPTGQ